MACWLSEDAKLQRRVNQEIERQLIRDRKIINKQIKLLLLGEEDGGAGVPYHSACTPAVRLSYSTL